MDFGEIGTKHIKKKSFTKTRSPIQKNRKSKTCLLFLSVVCLLSQTRYTRSRSCDITALSVGCDIFSLALKCDITSLCSVVICFVALSIKT